MEPAASGAAGMDASTSEGGRTSTLGEHETVARDKVEELTEALKQSEVSLYFANKLTS